MHTQRHFNAHSHLILYLPMRCLLNIHRSDRDAPKEEAREASPAKERSPSRSG